MEETQETKRARLRVAVQELTESRANDSDTVKTSQQFEGMSAFESAFEGWSSQQFAKIDSRQGQSKDKGFSIREA